MTGKTSKKNRLENRVITASARAIREAKRSSQDSHSNQEVHVDNVQHEGPEQEQGKRKWVKRPRTNDWKLTASAPRGPLSTELLRCYCGYVARYIWEKNEERGCLVIQSRTLAVDFFRFEPRDAWYLLVKTTGLGLLRDCMFTHHNAPLISAFVERWHPETNSFHLPFGEMTITLHDVSLIMGLPINGIAINHPMQHKDSRSSLFTFVGKLLNLESSQVEFEHSHSGIKLTKIRETLMDSKNKCAAEDIARGYLVTLLGSTIFIDKTVDRVSTLLFPLVRDLVSVKTYSWASAALSFLYRELGKATRSDTRQLAGSSTLLEAWIYEHFPMFRPMTNSKYVPNEHPRAMKWDVQTATPKLLASLQQHRWRLDNMKAEEVIWMPYGMDVVNKYPLSLYHGCIRYATIIEPYMPDRVLRQFGYVQTRPMYPITHSKEYKRSHSYSIEYPESMMCFWDDPTSHCLSDSRLGDLASNPWEISSDYMQWFSQCTHPKVQNPDYAPQGFRPIQHQLSAEARLHLIAHYIRPLYPEVRNQLSIEDQHYYMDQAIAVVQEFEDFHISQRGSGEGASKQQ